MYQKKKKDSNTIVFFLLVVSPLVDTLNGCLLLNNIDLPVSIGQLYRFVLIFVLFILLYKTKLRADLFWSFIVLCISLFLFALFHISYGTSDSVSGEFNNLIQWLFCPVFLFEMTSLIYYGCVDKKIVFDLFDSYMWIVPLTLLVPYILGTGSYTYPSEIGYKGFYYANNGISFFCSVLAIISLYNLVSKFSIKNLTKVALVFISCVLLGTKSAILSIIIAVFIALYFFIIRAKKKTIKRLLFFVFIILIVIICAATVFAEQIGNILSRFNYISSIYDGLIDSLSSGRITKLKDIWEVFKANDFCGLVFLFGQGFINNIAEMDFFDLFFSYGVAGILLVAIFVFNLKRITKVYNEKIYVVSIIFSILYSFIVGHVFTNSLSTMVFVLLICAIVDDGRKNNCSLKQKTSLLLNKSKK